MLMGTFRVTPPPRMAHSESKMNSFMVRFASVAAIIIVYVAALFLPVVGVRPNDIRQLPTTGLDALLMGWSGVGIIPELANIAIAIGLTAILLRRYTLAKIMGVIGFALGLIAPYFFEVHASDLRVAYYLWLLCPIMLFGTGVALSKSDCSQRPSNSIMRSGQA